MSDKRDGYAYEEIVCNVEHTTEDAVLVFYENEEEWIPRSLIHRGDDVEEGDERLEVARWKLQQIGWL